jgi:hypothetical protein
MTWLSRLFGSETGPVYGRGEIPFDRAKSELLALLRERGARAAVIGYDGGNDEGWLTELVFSAEPFQGEPEGWSSVTGSTIDVDAAYDDFETPDGKLVEAAEALVCDKWGSFAGEFHVDGRVFVDVDSGRIVRRDAVSVEDGPVETDTEVV